MQSAEVLVLKKTPYRESSLLVRGISPDDGRIDFIMKGAQNLGARKFPVIDIFRLVRIDFRPVADGLPTGYGAEAIASFDNVGNNAERYMLACELAAFALKNSSPQLPCPELCGAMRFLLDSLCREDTGLTPAQARLLLRLAFLNENGLLPDTLSADPARNNLLQRLAAILLEAAQGEMPLPGLDSGYWKQLEEWSEQLCVYHGIATDSA